MLGGCAANTEGTTETESTAFDEETDFVVVGGGTGIFAALTAHKLDKRVILFEKSGTIGGTVFFSGGAFWAPGSSLQDPKFSADDTPEAVATYMMNCDFYGIADYDLCLDYARNAGKAHDWVMNELNVPFAQTGMADYHNYEGAGRSRSILINEPFGDLGKQVMSSGLDIRLNSEVTQLITDKDGAVSGVVVKSGNKETRVKATQGVLLATGGFDHNESMRKTYLRTPLYGSVMVQGDTGDGHRMGIELGADLCNMPSVFPTVVFLAEDKFVNSLNNFDHWTYRFQPHSVIVNSFGKRFMNELTSYDIAGTALGNCEAAAICPNLSEPATWICDSSVIDYAGYPGANTEMPSWVHKYQTLEELADGEGIAKERFLQEMERYSGFCDTGKDWDFQRGEGTYTETSFLMAAYLDGRGDRTINLGEGLANRGLGKLETPPFYAAKIGAASFGTSGGLVVNENAQVLRNGEPIPGLYAAGCVAASYSGYMGGGTSISSGLYRGMRAANHALDLNLF